MESILNAIIESYTYQWIDTYLFTIPNAWLMLIALAIFNLLLKKTNLGFDIVRDKYMNRENQRDFEIFFDNYHVHFMSRSSDLPNHGDRYEILRTILTESEIDDIKAIIKMNPKRILWKESMQLKRMKIFMRSFALIFIFVNLIAILKI